MGEQEYLQKYRSHSELCKSLKIWSLQDRICVAVERADERDNDKADDKKKYGKWHGR